MATTTAAPATIVATARAARAEEIEPEALEVAVAAAGRRPNSVSEMLEVHGEELSDAIKESVETFKAPPPDGGGVPLPPAPAGFICAVRATRPSDGLDPFYTKVCMASGIPVVSSAAVNDSALVAAAGIVVHMLNPRPDLRQKLIDNRLRVGVIGIRENALMMPEYRDLKSVFPDDDWTSRAYSATMKRPLVAVPEENLLCLSNDSYPGQSVLTHELGHSVVDLAVRPLDGSFWGRVENAYAKAMQAGRFRNSYAATNAAEYWAEGVQDFFDASSVYVGANGAGNGYDSPIGNRGDLASYDPVLYGLIRDVFTENPWRPRCPT